MPITQSRMIALITAAEQLQTGLETLTDAYRLASERIRRGEITPAEAFAEFSVNLDLNMLLPEVRTIYATIAVESAHFARHQSKNNASARRLALKRRSQSSEHHSAPRSLIPIRETRLRAPELEPSTPAQQEHLAALRAMGITSHRPDLEREVSTAVLQQGESLDPDFSEDLSSATKPEES